VTVLSGYLCRSANRKCPIEPQCPHAGDADLKTRDWTPTLTHTRHYGDFRTTQYPPLRHLDFASHEAVLALYGHASQSKGLSIRPHCAVQVWSTAFPRCCLRSTDYHLGGLSVEHTVINGLGDLPLWQRRRCGFTSHTSWPVFKLSAAA
jgi:hypothetical protein